MAPVDILGHVSQRTADSALLAGGPIPYRSVRAHLVVVITNHSSRVIGRWNTDTTMSALHMPTDGGIPGAIYYICNSFKTNATFIIIH